MTNSIEADYRQAASAAPPTDSSDPIARSFAQYQTFAHLRCAVTSNAPAPTNASTKEAGSVSQAQTTAKTPDLILTKWVDRQGVLRTRNTFNDSGAQERMHEIQLARLRLEREMHRAWNLLINKDDIREHLLLNVVTVQALQPYVAGDYPMFLDLVLHHKLVTADLLIKIERGPVFDDWMIKNLIFEAVMASNADFNKKVADNAVAATAHYIANNGMVLSKENEIGHKEWKSESMSGLDQYFDYIDTSTTQSDIFTLFNQIVLQFGTPANIGSSTVEDLIGRAALAYAIIFQASTRAVEQLVRDTTAHAAKISLDVSVIIAAMTFGGSVTPSAYVTLAVDSIEGVLQTVITNYVNQPVTAITAVQSNLSDQFGNYILKPALAGDSVPGLFPGVTPSADASGTPAKAPSTAPVRKDNAAATPATAGGTVPPVLTPTPAPAPKPSTGSSPLPKTTPAATPSKGGSASTPPPNAAAQRMVLGQLFQTKYTNYLGMLDTVHTPMRKIQGL